MEVAVISSYSWIIRANNYGALLQYYALQQYLEKRGHHVYWIRCLSGGKEIKPSFIAYVKSLLKGNSICYNNAIECHRTFMNFVSKHLNLSAFKYSGNQDLTLNPPMADIYITGSDQVWGGQLKENYLQFVKDNSKKISYAASFGSANKPQEQLEIIKPWLKDFRAISVREASGVDICKSLGIDATLLIDPSLLLDSSEYPIKEAEVDDFIFCYFLNVKGLDNIRWEDLTRFAKIKHCRLKVCAVQGSEYLFPKEYLVAPSPEEWLGYYKNAKFVVTNSFHGTAFSIIFRKQFGILLQQGNSSNQNTRMENILSMFNLQSRIITPNCNLEDSMMKNINWQETRDLLVHQRGTSNVFFEKVGL
jgi:hypothetical protein